MEKEVVYQFLQPWWLVALPLPFVWLLLQRYMERKRAPAILYSDTSVLADLPKTFAQRMHYLLPWVRSLALLLGVIAMARPQAGNIQFNTSSLGVDIAMVLDVSGSMQAQDFRPNRLEAMKEAAVRFIRNRQSDRISIVVFGESAGVLCPPTLDMGAAELFVEAIQDQMIRNQSTAIGDGLALGVSKLKDSPAKSRVAILLTDGENNSGKILPLQAAEIAKTLNVRVYAISMGDDGNGGTTVMIGGQRMVIPNAQAPGTPPASDTLKEIARMTGGQYFHASDERALNQIYDEINTLEKTEIESTRTADFNEQFMLFWYPALALLVLEFLARAFWLRRFP
ncbi:MAG TPA: VWA domain-containing protein [Candidatus Sumerlaeota bacterium]|nr:VWA domain-containing protein [Candidatus Sumerlaeota bacterium]HMZ52537.1 VWA domain-containing protein [Candidatus Sumerlaeota bacterium]